MTEQAKAQMKSISTSLNEMGVMAKIEYYADERFLRIPLAEDYLVEISVDNPLSGEMVVMVYQNDSFVDILKDERTTPPTLNPHVYISPRSEAQEQAEKLVQVLSDQGFATLPVEPPELSDPKMSGQPSHSNQGSRDPNIDR